MPKKSTIATLLVSTAAAGLCGAVIAGAADTKQPTATTPSGQPGPYGYGGYGAGPGGHPGGRGHHGGSGRGFHADLAAVAKDLGVTEAQLQKAVEAARPDKPRDADKTTAKKDRGAETAAAIAKSLGESTDDVQDVLESLRPERPTTGERPKAGDRPAGPRAGGPGRDDTALVAALVKKFSVTEAKAQAAVDAARKAHEAEHTARENELYAAIAKSLDKDAAAVKKAFEDHRPTPPAAPTK